MTETAPSSPNPGDRSQEEILVHAARVGKIFCRDFKRSLYYGAKDALKDLIPGKKGGRLMSASGEVYLRKDEFWANHDLSFEIRKGECLGLIGHNGAGKTTLLKMLCGLIKPDTGQITMRGRVGALIALGAGFNPILTGRENIYVNASVMGFSRAEIDERFDEIVDFAELHHAIDSPVQNYSSGMQVRLGFAVATAIKPDILLLDEVLAVGDMRFQAKCFNTLSEFRKYGTSFILVSHNMHIIARYADRVLFLRGGKIVHDGDPDVAIKQFVHEMDSQGDEVPTTFVNWQENNGTGKVQFTGAFLLNARGERVQKIQPGGEITMAFEFKRNTHTLEDPILELAVRDGDDVLFRTYSNHHTPTFGKIPETGCFLVKFPAFSINTKKILVSICLLGRDSKEVFDWKFGIEFLIEKYTKHPSTLSFPVEMKVVETISST